MKCPEFSEVLDMIDGKLDTTSKQRIEQHINNGCHPCGELHRWAAQTIQLMKSDQIVEAPEVAIQKAVSLFQEKKIGVLDWVRAKLDFDSWAVPAMAGVRSEDRGPRQTVYVTENYKVVLMHPSKGQGNTLTGQLIARSPDALSRGCLVQLASKNKIVVSRFTNSAGEFLLGPIPARKFDLLILGDRESIRISL